MRFTKLFITDVLAKSQASQPFGGLGLLSDQPVGTRFRTDPGARAQCRISVRTAGHRGRRGQGQTAQGKQEPAARRCARFMRSPTHLISFLDVLKGSKVAVEQPPQRPVSSHPILDVR